MTETRTLDLPALENWLWEAACVIRGPIDAPKFKDYILPLLFLIRLSDSRKISRRAACFASEIFRTRNQPDDVRPRTDGCFYLQYGSRGSTR